MDRTNISVVFFGAGPVSLDTLSKIYPSIQIEGIITKPSKNKPKKNQPQTVEAWAKDHKIPVFLTSNKQELSEIFTKKKFVSSIGLVVDYGIIIPKAVIDYFDKGILNSHFSLLPQWRGADPITFSILSGQKLTGVSIMQIVPSLDEGDLLATREYQIAPTITIDVLTRELTKLSAQMLQTIIPRYLEGKIKPTPQSQKPKPTYSRKLTKQDGLVDCGKTAQQIEREVRAYLGWPKSQFKYKGLDIILLESKIAHKSIEPGKLEVHDGKLLLGCRKDALEIIRLQIAGKKPMDANSFINGYKNFIT